MKTYEFLRAKKESGELNILFQIGLPLHYLSWLDIYAYHLENPNESHWKVSLKFKTSKKTVYNCYRFMNQQLTSDDNKTATI